MCYTPAMFHRLRNPMLLGSLVFCLALLFASRMPVWGDAGLDFNAATSWLHVGTPSVAPDLRVDVFAGPDGRHYIKYPLLQTLLLVPGVWLFEHNLGPAGPTPRTWMVTAAPLATVAALGVVALYLLGRRFGLSERIACVGAVLAFFSSPWWVYARCFYGEGLQISLLLWVLWCWQRSRDPEASRGALFFLGFAAGLAVNTKVTLALWIPVLAVDLLRQSPTLGSGAKRLAWAVAGGIVPALLWMGYNQLRYGSPFALGYGTERDGSMGFGMPLPLGLYGLLLSPGKSILLYAPVFALLPAAALHLWRQSRQEALVLGAIGVPYLLLIAAWWSWSGDWAWGPRHLAPLLPVGFVTLLPWLARPAAGLRLPLALAVAGIAVNGLGALIHPLQYLSLVFGFFRPLFSGGLVMDDLMLVHWVPEFSPVIGHAWLLAVALLGLDPGTSPWRHNHVSGWQPPADLRPEVDLWWTTQVVDVGIVFGLALAAAGVGAVLWRQLGTRT
jgi:hypothetical protein